MKNTYGNFNSFWKDLVTEVKTAAIEQGEANFETDQMLENLGPMFQKTWEVAYKSGSLSAAMSIPLRKNRN